MFIFGAAGMSDFTHHEDEQRKQRYINRHKDNEIWSNLVLIQLVSGLVGCYGIKPTIKNSYMDIKSRFNIQLC
jgi:hypothetical protein